MFERLRNIFRSEPAEPWLPSDYRVEATDAGANINYDCYCSCDAGFALERAAADAAAESCCCGNRMLAGADAGSRLGAALPDAPAFRMHVQQLPMPWGETVEVALAIPEDPS